ncbi:MAG: hypothetical protein IJS96_06770 [Schwartzia sp.]|nr:hypothetical protein [Schwartzia sp. (in: firmicutes)]
MAKYTKDEAITILHQSVAEYHEKLSRRMFRLLYDKRLTQTTEIATVVFEPGNFKHLTGIQSDLSPRQFYKACLKHRLSVRDIDFDSFGHAQRKLEVLPFMADVFYNRCWIGLSINNDISINADYYVGDTPCVLSIGFRGKENGDVPVTLKNQSIREVVTKENKIYAIASKPLGNSTRTWTLTYCDNGFDPSPWF